jgi:hypothetical protein
LLPSGADAQAQPQLPRTDTTLSISQQQRMLDESLNARLLALESNVSNFQRRTDQRESSDRIKLLEEKVDLLEQRNQIERTRFIGNTKIKYTQGYKLLDDMEALSKPLSLEGKIISAYNSTFQLTDLRQYSGFNNNITKLLESMNNNAEKDWLRNLVGKAVIPAVQTIAEMTPLRNVANLAFDRLNSLLPIYTKSKMNGSEFVSSYESMSCALQAVNQMHDDINTLAVANARWQTRVDSMKATYPPLRQAYVSVVHTGSNPIADAQFYLTTEQVFEGITAAPSERYFEFTDVANRRIADFETSTLLYHNVVLEYLELWKTFKQVLELRRNTTCLSSDTSVQGKYNNAIRGIDDVIKEIHQAYLFEKNDKPEYEYYRQITGTLGK